MNKIKLKVIKNEAGEVEGPHLVYMHLSAVAEASEFGQALRAGFEVAILQGEQQPDNEGGTEYWFTVDDEQAAQLKRVLLAVYFPGPSN